MIASGQLARLEEVARGCGSVLDVGGWYRPFNLATHVLDLCPYDTRRRHDALDPHDAERFSADTWTIRDICDTPWPYADRQFDFVFCSHTLEDVRDPVAVCRELARVARAGYVEVPSRAREIFVKKRLSRLRGLLGRASEIGFRHHRWFCEPDGEGLVFLAKTAEVALEPDYVITREELGRKMTEAESGLFLWWEGGFAARERVMLDMAEELTRFKRDALAALRAAR